MAWNLKDNLFSYLGAYEKQADTFKDGNNKGVLERFNEANAEDYDDNHLVLILSLWENTRNPLACYQEYIQFLEDSHGIAQIAGQTEEKRRRVLRFYRSVVAKKGTKAAYDLLFYYLGFTVDSLVEDFTGQTLDSRFSTKTILLIQADAVVLITIWNFPAPTLSRPTWNFLCAK